MAAANERKDEFLAMLAHELRNPLAPISSAAQILRMPGMGAPQVAHAADVIGRQVRHMTELVDDLLDVSRVQRGLVELDCAPVDMQAAVQAAIEQARPLIERRGHVLVTRIASQAAVVLGDRKRLIQVVANLLTNAAKYTEPPGEITVTLHAGANEVRLDVADNGIGIEARLLPQIFDLFTQATRTPDRSQGGLGLGLALVRSLVGLHDGSVTVHSDGIGKGSVFTVRLPHHLAASAPAVHEPAPVGPRNGTSRRVLIVDDNLDGAEAMQQLLTAAGHAAEVAHDADAALGNAQPFDVYLLDIGLPGMSGHALAQELRRRPGSAAAKLIAVSGYGQQQDIAASLAAGCDAHITKPADIGALLALIGSERQPT
jgi:CheY-like chemotaxis protein/two-component sensor histidine kinase